MVGRESLAGRRVGSGTVHSKRKTVRVHCILRRFRRVTAKMVCARELRLMYVELHARSAFSFLEGASVPEELAGACASHEMRSMALLDRDGLYGSPRFHLAMKKLKLKAHIGAEVTCAENGRLVLLVASREGYQNLCRLLTRIKLRSEKGKGAIQLTEAAEFARGLICLTGGAEGLFSHSLHHQGVKQAAECISQLCAIFGKDNVYVELQ